MSTQSIPALWKVDGLYGRVPPNFRLPALVCGLLVVLSLTLWGLAGVFGLHVEKKRKRPQAKPSQASEGSIYLNQEGKTVRRSARIASGQTPVPKKKAV